MSALHRTTTIALAIAAALCAGPVAAQAVDHSMMHHPAPAPEPAKAKPKPKAKAKPKATPADPHAGHARSPPAAPVPAEDHATMEHATMDHSTMDHGSTQDDAPTPADQPRMPIPVPTDADRAAAFPPLEAHAAHDRSRHAWWLVDRLEASNGDEGSDFGWKASAWIGGDIHRLWLRSEGEALDGRVENGDIEVLAGRAITPWWDLVAGLRHEIGDGPSQTSAAIGVTGLAPYKIEVEATAYLGASGQLAARIEASYDTLLTNRLILQWHAEAQLHARRDEERGIGAGLGTLEAGLRLRYEYSRQFAPYLGLGWERAYGETADFRRAHLEDVSDTRVVAGIRFWF